MLILCRPVSEEREVRIKAAKPPRPNEGHPAGRETEVVAKQAILFAEASMLLPRETGIECKRARLGAAFFIAGATDFVAQANDLSDIEYLAVLSDVLFRVGLLSKPEATDFACRLPEASLTRLGQEGMIKGANAISDWLRGKDEMAPARLFTCIEEWAKQEQSISERV